MSVTLPVGQAMDRVKKVLFQPFDVGRWFVIGFCAWLACLGEGGGSPGGFHFGGHHGRGAQSIRAAFEEARDYVLHNLAWIVPLAIALVVVSVAVWLILMWLSSRGRFMFLHCVALNAAEVRVPWIQFAPEANSLFLFRLVISLIGLVLMFPLVGGLVLVVLRMVFRERGQPRGPAAGRGVSVHHDRRRDRVLDHWAADEGFCGAAAIPAPEPLPRRVAGTGRLVHGATSATSFSISSSGSCWRLCIAVVVVVAVLATCCIAGCLFALPYLGTVFLLPILVFERAYSLHYLAQFGRDYDVFSGITSPLPPSTPLRPPGHGPVP